MISLPVNQKQGILFVQIPQEYIPDEIKKKQVTPKRLKQPNIIETETYIYGGGGKITVDGIVIPRTGISGLIKEAIPTDMIVTHIQKNGIWIPVDIPHMLHPVTWSKNRWRSGIPIALRRKYKILPNDKVRVSYTEYITEFIPSYIGKLAIYYHGRQYNIRLNDDGSATWIIPNDIRCYETIKTSFDINIACQIQLEHMPKEFNKNIYIAEFIFSKIGGKYVSRKQDYAYRAMVVKNYSSVKTERNDYPELIEIRATYISSCPIEYYLYF